MWLIIRLVNSKCLISVQVIAADLHTVVMLDLSTTPSHLAHSFSVTPFKFMAKVYGS